MEKDKPPTENSAGEPKPKKEKKEVRFEVDEKEKGKNDVLLKNKNKNASSNVKIKKKKPAVKSQKSQEGKLKEKQSKTADKFKKDVLKETDLNVEKVVECKIEHVEDKEAEKSGQAEQMDTQNNQTLTILVKSEKMEEDEECEKAETEGKDGKEKSKDSKDSKGSDSDGKKGAVKEAVQPKDNGDEGEEKKKRILSHNIGELQKLNKPDVLSPVFKGAENEKIKTIKQGKEALKRNKDVLTDRDQKPWEKTENLVIGEDGKPKFGEDEASKKDDIIEQDVQAFEELLEEDQPSNQGSASANQNPTTSTTEAVKEVKVEKPKIKSTVTKVVKDVFFVKKKYAKLAETDRDSVYDPDRRTKCLETITDLAGWTNENVVQFENGKLFQTLLTSDALFENKGLSDHENAQDYLRAKTQPPINRGPPGGNTMEFGFKVFARNVIKDVFKCKARGLALRNFEVATSRGCTRAFRAKFGEFLDKILEVAEEKEGSAGRLYIQIDRFKLEEIKEEKVSYLTDEKIGTYPIDVYTADVIVSKNKWLVDLLDFNSFCWDAVTMMRFVARKTKAPLQEFFSNTEVNEYNESSLKLVKMFRDSNLLKPGPISITLMTPFNTSWFWDDTIFIIRPIETWTEYNIVSELTKPVTLDKMLEILIDPISKPNIRYNGFGNQNVVYDYYSSLCNVVDDPCKFLKCAAQIQGRVEVAGTTEAFVEREKDDLLVLQYPKEDDPHYQEIVQDKQNYLSQENVPLEELRKTEGDRRRNTMYVEGVLDPTHYIAGMSDFLLTISKTMEETLRPPQQNGRRGKMIIFEEGVLCQKKTVHPGTECKLSTGNTDYAGWYAAVVATVRRLIMEKNDLNHDGCTVMKKSCINFLNVNRDKANTFMTSLKHYHASEASNHFKRRLMAPAGKIVHEYITECAAMIKRIFVRDTASRREKAKRKFNYPVEADRCFKYLNTTTDGAVLRYCRECKDVSCPINLIMARFMTRTAKFVADYNGTKGTRLILKDFFDSEEINFYTKKFVDSERKPIAAIGEFGEGIIGPEDEVTDDIVPTRFRLLNGDRISEEILEIFPSFGRRLFPETMRPDTYEIEYQVDIDQKEMNEAMMEDQPNANEEF